jgi:hypothetical protein
MKKENQECKGNKMLQRNAWNAVARSLLWKEFPGGKDVEGVPGHHDDLLHGIGLLGHRRLGLHLPGPLFSLLDRHSNFFQ